MTQTIRQPGPLDSRTILKLSHGSKDFYYGYLNDISDKQWKRCLFKIMIELRDQIAWQRVDLYFELLDRYDREVADSELQFCGGAMSDTLEDQLSYSSANLEDERKERLESQKKALPFVCESFDKHVSIVSGLWLIGAMSGNGKSTVASNIIARILRTSKDVKRIVVVSNEETPESVYSRIACNLMEISWIKYWDNELEGGAETDVLARMDSISKTVNVINKTPTLDMTILEDVIHVLDEVKNRPSEYNLILVDYYQTVVTSRSHPQMSSHEILKKLGSYLKQFCIECKVPLIVFAQLKDKEHGGLMKSRVENDTWIYNHAHNAIEVEADFKLGRTIFSIYKLRYGKQQGFKVATNWVQGRLEPVSMFDL